MNDRPKLTFISPRFLLPADSGGKIRTTQILRSLKGGEFHVTLVMPAAGTQRFDGGDLERLCDRLVSWDRDTSGPIAAKLRRAVWLLSESPIPVISDWSLRGARAVAAALAERPDIVVFDFPHSAILADDVSAAPSVMFTHNVEAEIWRRHAENAQGFLRQRLYRQQWKRMLRFEGKTIGRFDRVLAVSDVDRDTFERLYPRELRSPISVIPTGVGFSCRKTGKAIRSGRITRSKAPASSSWRTRSTGSSCVRLKKRLR